MNFFKKKPEIIIVAIAILLFAGVVFVLTFSLQYLAQKIDASLTAPLPEKGALHFKIDEARKLGL